MSKSEGPQPGDVVICTAAMPFAQRVWAALVLIGGGELLLRRPRQTVRFVRERVS